LGEERKRTGLQLSVSPFEARRSRLQSLGLETRKSGILVVHQDNYQYV